MSKTIESLQAFVKTWGPVVEAVPAVIQAMQEVDYYTSQKSALQKDIERMVAELETVKVTWREAEAAWQKNLADLQAAVAAANQQVSDANSEAKKAVAAANKRAADAEKSSLERVGAANLAIDVEREKLKISMNEAKEAYRQEIAALEMQKQEAQVAYEDMKRKLEDFKASLGA
jgi:chaperonin cofactor prefoldin